MVPIIGQDSDTVDYKMEILIVGFILQVEPVFNNWDDDSDPTRDSSKSNTKMLIGNITSLTKNSGYINQTTFFTVEEVCEGMWVLGVFFYNVLDIPEVSLLNVLSTF